MKRRLPLSCLLGSIVIGLVLWFSQNHMASAADVRSGFRSAPGPVKVTVKMTADKAAVRTVGLVARELAAALARDSVEVVNEFALPVQSRALAPRRSALQGRGLFDPSSGQGGMPVDP
ncbi:MAG: hypothetical protein ABSH20_02485 [Tepidisphaeraceae bacterium]